MDIKNVSMNVPKGPAFVYFRLKMNRCMSRVLVYCSTKPVSRIPANRRERNRHGQAPWTHSCVISNFRSPCAVRIRSCPPKIFIIESYDTPAGMERAHCHHHYNMEHNQRHSPTTTTIASLSWPPRRNASFLKAGYPGLEASLCLDFDPVRSTQQARSQPPRLTMATIHQRLSTAPPVPPFPRRSRSGEQQAPSRSSSRVSEERGERRAS